ncbi:MAG: hypothetical protein U1E76_19640 [Planctomycetota bacterium]
MRIGLALTLAWVASAGARGYQHLPPHGELHGARSRSESSDWSHDLWVEYDAASGARFEGGIRSGSKATLAWRPLQLEGYAGAERALEAYGRLLAASGEPRPSLYVAAYFASDGASWAEVCVGAESIRNPAPGLDGNITITAGEDVLLERRVTCPDQTGIALRLGTPFPIVHEQLLAKLAARVPKMAVPDGAIRRAIDGADPDPTWDTHTTGSPRNTYWAPDLVLWICTKDQRLLDHLSDFTLAQYGSVGADGRFRPGRPYHLSDDAGQPWQAETSYAIDASELKPARMFEGRPRLQEQGIDTLGRGQLFGHANPRPPRNGYDQEHMEAERLFAAAILLRSERARRDLMHLAEGQWSEKSGIYHSSRTLGWCLRLYVRAYQLFQRQKDRARLDEILTRAITMKNFGGRAKITSFMTRDYWKEGNVPGFTWEATWQAATIATAAYEAMQALDQPDDVELRSKAEDVFLHAASCCLVGWKPDTATMIDSYEIFTETAPGSGIPSLTKGDSRMGVAMWPVAALALAFEHTRDEKFGAPARTLTQLAKQSRAENVPLNSVRSRSLMFFLEANRIFKVQPEG